MRVSSPNKERYWLMLLTKLFAFTNQLNAESTEFPMVTGRLTEYKYLAPTRKVKYSLFAKGKKFNSNCMEKWRFLLRR